MELEGLLPCPHSISQVNSVHATPRPHITLHKSTRTPLPPYLETLPAECPRALQVIVVHIWRQATPRFFSDPTAQGKAGGGGGGGGVVLTRGQFPHEGLAHQGRVAARLARDATHCALSFVAGECTDRTNPQQRPLTSWSTLSGLPAANPSADDTPLRGGKPRPENCHWVRILLPTCIHQWHSIWWWYNLILSLTLRVQFNLNRFHKSALPRWILGRTNTSTSMSTHPPNNIKSDVHYVVKLHDGREAFPNNIEVQYRQSTK
jgi:hypothetical protein